MQFTNEVLAQIPAIRKYLTPETPLALKNFVLLAMTVAVGHTDGDMPGRGSTGALVIVTALALAEETAGLTAGVRDQALADARAGADQFVLAQAFGRMLGGEEPPAPGTTAH